MVSAQASRAASPHIECKSVFQGLGRDTWLVLFGLVALCVLPACTRLSGADDGLDAFRDALASARGVAPRLSIATEFRECTEHDRRRVSGAYRGRRMFHVKHPHPDCSQRGG